MKSSDTKHVDPGDTATASTITTSPLDPFVVIRVGSGQDHISLLFGLDAVDALASLAEAALEAERSLRALDAEEAA